LYISVLDPATEDFKASAQEFLFRADAIILHRSESSSPSWRSAALNQFSGRPIFVIQPPTYVTSEIVEFVDLRLKALASATSLA
jgi:hypothetical protein